MKYKMAIVTAPHVVKVPKNFLIFRTLQLSLAVLILSLSIYGAVYLPSPLTGIILSLVTSLCTIIVSSYTLVATYGDIPTIYNYWAILVLEVFIFAFWLVSFAFLAFPVSEAFYFVNGGRGGRYSRYEYGYEVDREVIVFVDFMMVAVVAGAVEFILYFITVVTFSTIVHYHRRNNSICTCIDPESGHAIEYASKAISEKAQAEPESLIYPMENSGPEHTDLELTDLEHTVAEHAISERNAHE